MDAPTYMQTWLNTCARAPETAIAIVKALCTMAPRSMLDKILSCTMNDKGGRDIAVQLLQIPTFVRNFGLLGFEEIRDVPQSFDVCGLMQAKPVMAADMTHLTSFYNRTLNVFDRFRLCVTLVNGLVVQQISCMLAMTTGHQPFT